MTTTTTDNTPAVDAAWQEGTHAAPTEVAGAQAPTDEYANAWNQNDSTPDHGQHAHPAELLVIDVMPRLGDPALTPAASHAHADPAGRHAPHHPPATPGAAGAPDDYASAWKAD